MSFLPKLLRAFAFIPAVIQGIEAIFGAKTGAQKKESALSFVQAALQLTEAIANRDIATGCPRSLTALSSASTPAPGPNPASRTCPADPKSKDLSPRART
jgi:hypothetical protein